MIILNFDSTTKYGCRNLLCLCIYHLIVRGCQLDTNIHSNNVLNAMGILIPFYDM